jgi:hypothetical protein
VLQPPRRAAGDSPEDMKIGDQRLRCRGFGAHGRLPRVVGDTQYEPGIGEYQLAGHIRAGDVVLIQPADLPGAESMWRDRVGEAHAVARVGARHRHEVLHRGVRNDAAALDVLLDRVGQGAH